jgi:hypothetical protein
VSGWASGRRVPAGRAPEATQRAGERAPERRGGRMPARASTGGHTAAGRAPEGRPRATTERRVAATRWMERPHRDALKRESTGIRGAGV